MGKPHIVASHAVQSTAAICDRNHLYSRQLLLMAGRRRFS